MSESMNTPEWREAELRARVRELEYQLERWQEQVKSVQGEVDFLRGVGCMEDGDGPCGACLKCQKAKVKELEAENAALRKLEQAARDIRKYGFTPEEIGHLDAAIADLDKARGGTK